MPSPFPGMNPYLEQEDAWHDFHESFMPRMRRLAERSGRSALHLIHLSVATDGHLQGTVAGRKATANFRYPPDDRSVEVACSTLVAYADRHVFQNHKAPLVAEGFPIDSPRLDMASTVFAGEFVHGPFATLSSS